MAGDVTFEVIAVSSFPSGPKSWWRPDGTPLDEPPADPMSYPVRQQPDEERRIVLARIERPKDANLRWLPTFDGGSSGQVRPGAARRCQGWRHMSPRSAGIARPARSRSGSRRAPGRPKSRTTAEAVPAWL